MENTNGNSNGDNAIVTAIDWKIVHIPDKPSVPPHLQPTVNVHAAVIEPKHANTLIRKLNQIVPLENLRHVKRVRKKHLDGGKCELSVILCLASESDGKLDGMLNEVLELIKQFQLSTFVAKVCKYAASTKEEWEEQCKFWPTSYHPPTYNIPGITGFSEEDAQSVLCFMKNAVDLAKSSANMVVNAAVIVDPSTKQVISSACDQLVRWTTPKSKTNRETNCSELPEPTINGQASDMKKPQESFLSHSSCDSKKFYNCVSCLHPWQLAQQQLTVSSGSWHPLRHAAMVAIEYSAARDRLLFPGNGHCGDEFIQEDHMLFPKTGLPSKRQKVNHDEDEENPVCKAYSFQSESVRPYLCTGYDIYLVWEPCTMCAMALVHQRFKRIFYALPNPTAGALGSVHRLQGERSLNHHFAVFRVLLPEDTIEDDNIINC